MIQTRSCFKEVDSWCSFSLLELVLDFLKCSAICVFTREWTQWASVTAWTLPSPHPNLYYKVLSSVSKMRLITSIGFIDEKHEAQRLRTSPLSQLHTINTRWIANFLAYSIDLSTSSSFIPQHWKQYLNKSTLQNTKIHYKTWPVRLHIITSNDTIVPIRSFQAETEAQGKTQLKCFCPGTYQAAHSRKTIFSHYFSVTSSSGPST